MAGEYSVKVSIRNGLILRQMKKLGIESQTALARLCGLSIAQVNGLVTMRRAPVSKQTGDWFDDAYAISAALHTEPEELWTEKQRGMALKHNSTEVSMDEESVARLSSGQQTNRMLEDMILKEETHNAIRLLSPREADIIGGRFFEGETLGEVGERTRTSRERIRQIEAHALRKLKKVSELEDIITKNKMVNR
jgi:DNA-directed RNA polymerase specialized sigma subunit